MEHFRFFALIYNIYPYIKINKTLYTFFILLNIIITYNSLSTEIKLLSIPYPYLPFNSNIENSKIRNLSEQFIYGSAFKLNYYYSNLYIGEDMQKQGLILDTGSSITTATCSPLCEKCGEHICLPYNIKSKNKIISCSDEKCKMVSSNCNRNTISNCSFGISYSEGSSLKGVFINELVRFGENYIHQEGKEIPIGCTTSETHLFYKQEVNGIMGLANNEYNFVELLYNLGAIKRNIFCLCYAQLGGVFTIGEINNDLHTENITYLPMITDRKKYFGLDIKSIFVNDKKIGNFTPGEYNIFIDSGTTISYFNNIISDEIIDIMKTECSKFNKKEACGKYEYLSDYGHCYYFNNTYELDFAVKNYWPTIHFKLDNYDYKWTPERYVFNITGKNKTGACMGFNKVYGKKITLGASWIIGHDIIFDKENKLLGFAEANCYKNKKLNFTNGLEIFNKKEKIKSKFKIDFSLIVIIFANILLVLLILFIFWIIFRQNKQRNILKEMQLKIREHNELNKNKNNSNNKDSSYIKVLDDSLRSKTQISLN